jgi:hypothetical protein
MKRLPRNRAHIMGVRFETTVVKTVAHLVKMIMKILLAK